MLWASHPVHLFLQANMKLRIKRMPPISSQYFSQLEKANSMNLKQADPHEQMFFLRMGMNKAFQFWTQMKKTNKINWFIRLSYLVPTKISISLTEKGLLIPHFLGGNISIFGGIYKNGYIYVPIFGNVSKNGYITKMTTVCPTRVSEVKVSVTMQSECYNQCH